MNKSRGFTLLELLVVIAIIAILAALAVPSFKNLIQSNTMSGAVNTFMADLRFARSESIRRGGAVIMCRSDDAETTATCGTGSTVGWESGWIIFHDLNNTGTRTSNEPLLRVQAPITAVNTIAEVGAATVFKFTATGRLNLSAATKVQFGSTPDYAIAAQRVVCVHMGGRARIALDSAGKATGYATCSTDQ